MAYFYVQLCAMTLLFRLRDGMADLRVSMPNFHYVQNRHKQQNNTCRPPIYTICRFHSVQNKQK